MFELTRFAVKLNIQNSKNSTGNCVHYMHGMSGIVEKLNIHCVNSTENYVNYICTKCLDLQKNWMSTTA